MDGKQQHTYQYDSNTHRLLTFPYRITTNNNKDIVVVDMTSGIPRGNKGDTEEWFYFS
jgi:hypothetical protein